LKVLKLRRERLSDHDSISGWAVGLNTGEATGQTVLHGHWHLIPVREEDWKEPMDKARKREILKVSLSTFIITRPMK
jgi:ATP adenylyltransferase